MRRLTTVLISWVLAAGVTGPATAQEAAPGPPWWPGDRAEMAERGFALTIPDGWVAFDLSGDLQGQVRTIAAELELTDDAAQSFTEGMLRTKGRGTLLVLSSDDANCEFQVYPPAGPGESEALASQRYEAASNDEDILDVDRPRLVTLPSGAAYHMSWTNDTGNPELSLYLGQQESLAYEIKCSGQSRPEDDWLSVAESFEWLPAPGTTDPGAGSAGPSPVPAGSLAVPAGPPYPDRVEGTGVYDQAEVFGPFAVGLTEQVIRDVEEASGAQVVVYTQVKPESDTFEEAEADAAALMRQWNLEPDGLVILLDLDQGLCYGQIQLYASAGYAARHLSSTERQALFDEAIIPPLEECDFDTALLAAMSRINAAAEAVSPSAGSPAGDPATVAPSLLETLPDATPTANENSVTLHWSGGRVEMTDPGFALTIPVGWVAFDIEGDLEAQVGSIVEATHESWDLDAEGLLERLLATRGQYDLVATDLDSIAAGDPATTQSCNVATTGALEDFTLDELVSLVADEFRAMELVTVVRGPEALDLPSGPAYVIDITQPGPEGLEAPVSTAVYLVARPDEYRTIYCLGPTTPADDWLSIVRTWEWLPLDADRAEQATGSRVVGLGGRIEVPGQGYALTTPDGWISMSPTAEDADSILDALGDIDPDLAATAEAALTSGTSFSLLAFGDYDAATGFRENCNVIDYASDGDPIRYRLSEDALAVKDMEQLASGPETTILELPAGDVGRLDYGLQYPDFETAHAAYYFTDGSTFHLMTCTNTERPEDDWLSIAETWEWLDVVAS